MRIDYNQSNIPKQIPLPERAFYSVVDTLFNGIALFFKAARTARTTLSDLFPNNFVTKQKQTKQSIPNTSQPAAPKITTNTSTPKVETASSAVIPDEDPEDNYGITTEVKTNYE